jgi:hypothetical protein
MSNMSMSQKRRQMISKRVAIYLQDLQRAEKYPTSDTVLVDWEMDWEEFKAAAYKMGILPYELKKWVEIGRKEVIEENDGWHRVPE